MCAGCLIVRVTEHRIRIDDDGSGEARLRLTDLRSDAEADSAVAEDFAIMISSFEEKGIQDFEKGGRRVRSKRFLVHGDTLSAEIVYSFASTDDIEGLVVNREEMYVVVREGRTVMRTNGTVRLQGGNSVRIVWPRDCRRLSYEIREDRLPPSVSLAGWYRRYSE
jgi:hypothetical protein